MHNDILSLLIPLSLTFGEVYVKNNPEKEPFATRSTWKIVVIIGCVLFSLRLIMLIMKYV